MKNLSTLCGKYGEYGVQSVFLSTAYSVHSRNLKTGAHRAPTWQKSGDITKNVGPHVITHLIGLVSLLLAMLSLVRHCES